MWGVLYIRPNQFRPWGRTVWRYGSSEQTMTSWAEITATYFTQIHKHSKCDINKARMIKKNTRKYRKSKYTGVGVSLSEHKQQPSSPKQGREDVNEPEVQFILSWEPRVCCNRHTANRLLPGCFYKLAWLLSFNFCMTCHQEYIHFKYCIQYISSILILFIFSNWFYIEKKWIFSDTLSDIYFTFVHI